MSGMPENDSPGTDDDRINQTKFFMIIREIIKHPELIEKFDFFNDAKDTINWLVGKGETELANKLNAADKTYWFIKNARLSARRILQSKSTSEMKQTMTTH